MWGMTFSGRLSKMENWKKKEAIFAELRYTQLQMFKLIFQAHSAENWAQKINYLLKQERGREYEKKRKPSSSLQLRQLRKETIFQATVHVIFPPLTSQMLLDKIQSKAVYCCCCFLLLFCLLVKNKYIFLRLSLACHRQMTWLTHAMYCRVWKEVINKTM